MKVRYFHVVPSLTATLFAWMSVSLLSSIHELAPPPPDMTQKSSVNKSYISESSSIPRTEYTERKEDPGGNGGKDWPDSLAKYVRKCFALANSQEQQVWHKCLALLITCDAVSILFMYSPSHLPVSAALLMFLFLLVISWRWAEYFEKQ